MPQLDKLSFATQYFWLTLFFFGLYFLTVNFFVILVFKNLKLRNIIYKIWYFFLYHFDYLEYYNKNKQLNNASFNSVYLNLYNSIILSLKSILIFNTFNSILNKSLTLTYFYNLVNKNELNSYLDSNYSIVKITELNNLNIDEI